jgi:MscS family membrane protein
VPDRASGMLDPLRHSVAATACRIRVGGRAARTPRACYSHHNRSSVRFAIRRLLGVALLLALASDHVHGQEQPGAPPSDVLGRGTPRGTVLAFLAAGRRGDNALARQYLNTRLGGTAAEDLAHQLYVVLDARLPPTLALLSDAPDGSRANPLEPDREHVGTIAGPDGPIEIALERVARPRSAPIWLFSGATLDAIPRVYEDVASRRARAWLPRFLMERRIGRVRLLEWIAILLAVAAMYLMTVVLNRLLTVLVAPVWRRVTRRQTSAGHDVLPMPARLLLITLLSGWIFERLAVSLLVRQVLAAIAVLVATIAIAWLVILFNGVVERRLLRRVPAVRYASVRPLLHVGRRAVDVLVVIAAGIAVLRQYGVDPTPVLAGLGVGGLAIALAAQKTLENVIAGASLIFDQALRVGDFLKLGELQGTVDHIGLRSTRIRTLDRSIVTVPNGQIANMSLEILSDRDRYWFHPIVQLRYETTPAQLHAVVDGIRALLDGDPAVDRATVRVRFLRLGTFSLDVEVFAYVFARDWPHFLELQEQLLFRVMAVVSEAGAAIAFPSQTMYVTKETVAESA